MNCFVFSANPTDPKVTVAVEIATKNPTGWQAIASDLIIK